jgi:hypothetical protein
LLSPPDNCPSSGIECYSDFFGLVPENQAQKLAHLNLPFVHFYFSEMLLTKTI